MKIIRKIIEQFEQNLKRIKNQMQMFILSFQVLKVIIKTWENSFSATRSFFQ